MSVPLVEVWAIELGRGRDLHVAIQLRTAGERKGAALHFDGLAGEVGAQCDRPLIRLLIERVRHCAAHHPILFCTDGLCSYIRTIRETFRDPMYTGVQGRPRLCPWCNLCIAQVVKRYAQRRVVDVEHRIVEGPPAHVETLQHGSHGDGVINTAYIERLNATFRERLVSLTLRGRVLARRPLTLHHRMYLIGTIYNFYTPHASLSRAWGATTPAMAAGITEHCWSVQELLSVVSRAATSLDAIQATWASLACAQTPH